jgi:hypothetical protein
LSQNELLENINNEIFHKIYAETAFRVLINGKNLGPPTKVQGTITEKATT